MKALITFEHSSLPIHSVDLISILNTTNLEIDFLLGKVLPSIHDPMDFFKNNTRFGFILNGRTYFYSKTKSGEEYQYIFFSPDLKADQIKKRNKKFQRDLLKGDKILKKINKGKPIGENLKTRWGRYDPEENVILASKSDPQSNLVTETQLKEMKKVSIEKFESSDRREVTKKLRTWHEKHGDQKWYKGLESLLKGADNILQENKAPDELLGKIVSVGVVKPIGEKKHIETFQGKVERIFATTGNIGEKWLNGMNFYMVIMTEKGPITINTYKSRYNIYFLKDL